MIIASVESVAYDTEKFDDNLLRNLERGAPCIHFTQYSQGDGQVHVFGERINDYKKIFVSYPERDLKRKE